jgi:hypothetical protein
MRNKDRRTWRRGGVEAAHDERRFEGRSQKQTFAVMSMTPEPRGPAAAPHPISMQMAGFLMKSLYRRLFPRLAFLLCFAHLLAWLHVFQKAIHAGRVP